MRRNHSKHYCRLCPASFGPTRGPQISAHRLANWHLADEHIVPQVLACTKHCELAEQHAEKRAGVRLYGPGAEPFPTPIKTYEELYGTEGL